MITSILQLIIFETSHIHDLVKIQILIVRDILALQFNQNVNSADLKPHIGLDK